MIRRYFIRTLLFFFALSFLVTDVLAAINKEDKIDYDISVHIDPITRSIEGRSIKFALQLLRPSIFARKICKLQILPCREQQITKNLHANLVI